MLNALGADQPVGQLLYFFGFPAKDDNLETAFMIQVGMQRGDDHVMMLVLEVCKFFGQKAGVVVVDEGNGAHHKGVGSDHCRADQTIANLVEVAKMLLWFRGTAWAVGNRL